MKKRLLLTVFVVTLLLAGLGTAFAVEAPGGGGTVPDGEHQVWLPVVGSQIVPRECLMGDFVAASSSTGLHYTGWRIHDRSGDLGNIITT